MEIVLLAMGKTDDRHIHEGIEIYRKRLGHYIKFSIRNIPDIKIKGKITEARQNELEGVELLKGIAPGDFVVVLDEKGSRMNSRAFAESLQKWMNQGPSKIVFLIGGPYGFGEEVRNRAQFRLSLSDMTFNHQMVRLFFVEQIYRAMTILRNEPYHHD